MLKFLDNRFHEKPQKSPIKFKPEMIYGISAEAPTQFQTPHTIVHQNTYVNPYLNFEKKRSSCLPPEKTKFIEPEWAKKVNLQLVEEQKIISSKNDASLENSLNSRYRKSYYDQINLSEHRFKKTRGEFTNFIEKNNHYKSVGPIHGEERTQTRIQQTKKSVWFKPDITQSGTATSKKNSMLYTTYFDIKRQNSLNDNTLGRNSSTMSNNSKMLTEKTRIRDNRKKINHNFQNQIVDRKKKCVYNFELPKIQSDIEMNYARTKIMPTYERHETDEDLKDLDRFEKRLQKKFR